MVSFLYREMDNFHPFAVNYNGMYDLKHINICVPSSLLSQGIELCPELKLKNIPSSQLHSYCLLTEGISQIHYVGDNLKFMTSTIKLKRKFLFDNS